MLKSRAALLSLALALVPAAASAQFSANDDVVDRVLAVVGDSVILRSEVEETIAQMALAQTEVPPPTDPAYQEFFKRVLDNEVNTLLVLQAAAKDTLIKADDANIEQLVSDRIAQLISQFGGQSGLTDALAKEGLTLAEYRELLKGQAKQQQIQQMFYQARLRDARPVDVSEEELRQRFEDARGQLTQRPKLLTFRQVVIVPKASEEAKEAARQKAESLLERIRAGESFEELAKRNSDDPGSAQLGGDLGWFRRGRMVEEFENVAFSLPVGQVSNVVETDFGYHIIRIDRSRPGERQGRHILIQPKRTEADVQRAKDLASEVLRRAQSGESMAQLFEEYSDPAAPDSLTVAVDQIGQLPPAYSVLSDASTGQFIGPLEYKPSDDETRFAVIHVDQVREAGAYTFEDVRPQIASQLQREKQIDRIIADLRERTYIEIRG